MTQRLIVKKVSQAEAFHAQAEHIANQRTGRKPIRPGDWMYYVTYTDEGRVHGRGKVEMLRPGHSHPVFIREVGQWLTLKEVAGLPKDRWPCEE